MSAPRRRQEREPAGKVVLPLWLPRGLQSYSRPEFGLHVLDDLAVFVLGAKQDELRIGLDLHVVTWRPIEQIVGTHRLALAAGVSGRELAAQDEAPVRAMTDVAREALEQRRRVHARSEREVLSADASVAFDRAEAFLLANGGAGDLDAYGHFVFVYSHGARSFSDGFSGGCR